MGVKYESTGRSWSLGPWKVIIERRQHRAKIRYRVTNDDRNIAVIFTNDDELLDLADLLDEVIEELGLDETEEKQHV